MLRRTAAPITLFGSAMNPALSRYDFDDYALLLGRIGIACLFLPSGLSKLVHFTAFAHSLAAKTLPFGVPLPLPILLAIVAVTIAVVGPLLILLGTQTRWVSLVMIAFVVMASLTTHRYWEMQGAMRQANQVNFYKNLGLMGGFLFLYVSGPGALSWDAVRQRLLRGVEFGRGAAIRR